MLNFNKLYNSLKINPKYIEGVYLKQLTVSLKMII